MHQCIIAFPQDHETWRVDWFGDVLYQRQYRYTQPFIRVSLSRVTLDSLGNWVYPERFGSWIEQIQAVVPVGMLGMLTIGSIWCDGQLVAEPPYVQETLTVSTECSASQLVKAGIQRPDGSFILPFDRHPYHRTHTHSYCLQAILNEGVRLIIPAPELIRFYFGSSSSLLGRLFQGPFREQRLWAHAEIDAYRHATIDLAKGISGMSAAHVARIAFDPYALSAAKTVSASLLSATDSDGKAYPKMPFPFSGRSDLRAKGVWLSESYPKTFLAFQIMSCSHSFPFTGLTYSMARKQDMNGPGDASSGDGASRHFSGWSNSKAIVSEPPGGGKGAFLSRYLSASKFPDLDRKMVARVDPIAPVRVVVSESGEIVAGSAVGDGEGKSEIRPADLVAVADAPVSKGHPLEGTEFAKYVDEVVQGLLKQRKQVWFVPLDSRQRYPQFSVMPKIVGEDGKAHPLSYIEDNGKKRPRYISILRVRGVWPMGTKIWLIPEGELGAAMCSAGQIPMKYSVEEGDEVNTEWVALHAGKGPIPK